jgi:hypothetical protein
MARRPDGSPLVHLGTVEEVFERDVDGLPVAKLVRVRDTLAPGGRAGGAQDEDQE